MTGSQLTSKPGHQGRAYLRGTATMDVKVEMLDGSWLLLWPSLSSVVGWWLCTVGEQRQQARASHRAAGPHWAALWATTVRLCSVHIGWVIFGDW